jgi:hypothetical protein
MFDIDQLTSCQKQVNLERIIFNPTQLFHLNIKVIYLLYSQPYTSLAQIMESSRYTN